MSKHLEHSVAIITGASSGIGQATAKRLAASGARVVLVARRANRLEVLAEEIRDGGGAAKVIAADITRAAEASGVIAQTIAEFGRLDTRVHCHTRLTILSHVHFEGADEWLRRAEIRLRRVMS